MFGGSELWASMGALARVTITAAWCADRSRVGWRAASPRAGIRVLCARHVCAGGCPLRPERAVPRRGLSVRVCLLVATPGAAAGQRAYACRWQRADVQRAMTLRVLCGAAAGLTGYGRLSKKKKS